MTDLDMDVAGELTEKLFGYLEGSVVSTLVYLGDSLGLYKAMQDAGPLTADELAAKTGLHARWLREWLRNQGAAGLVDYRGDDRFELTAEQAAMLADEENSVLFSAGGFARSACPLVRADKGVVPNGGRPALRRSRRRGNHGVRAHVRTVVPSHARPRGLPALDGVVAKLEAGAKVADMGCGAGIALITMAKAFPNSEFHGYELSQEALKLAGKNLGEAGLKNVTFHDLAARAGADRRKLRLRHRVRLHPRHDASDPGDRYHPPDDQGRRHLLIADIKGRSVPENLAENPMVAMMYGFSVLSLHVVHALGTGRGRPGDARLPRGQGPRDGAEKPGSHGSRRTTSATR